MAYKSPGQVMQGKFSRRSFMKTTAAGVAAAATTGASFMRIAEAADGLRSIGLGVSEINEIQGKATKDLGFPVAGQAMGYGEMFSKMLNQNDQYEIAEGYYNDMDVMLPAKIWQPIDTKKLKAWDKVTNLTKTGKLTPDSSVGQGDAHRQDTVRPEPRINLENLREAPEQKSRRHHEYERHGRLADHEHAAQALGTLALRVSAGLQHLEVPLAA